MLQLIFGIRFVYAAWIAICHRVVGNIFDYHGAGSDHAVFSYSYSLLNTCSHANPSTLADMDIPANGCPGGYVCEIAYPAIMVDRRFGVDYAVAAYFCIYIYYGSGHYH